MKNNSTNLMLTVAAAAISTLLAPSTRAGCGKQLAVKLAVQAPGDQSLARAGQIEKSEDNAGPASSAVGLWAVNVTFGGEVIYQAFESFTSDGLEFLNDNGPTLEGNVCFGSWATSSRNAIKVYHPSWSYDMSGNLIGTVIIKEQITIDQSGKTFKGMVVVNTYDLNGKISAPELQAEVSGKRINPNTN